MFGYFFIAILLQLHYPEEKTAAEYWLSDSFFFFQTFCIFLLYGLLVNVYWIDMSSSEKLYKME